MKFSSKDTLLFIVTVPLRNTLWVGFTHLSCETPSSERSYTQNYVPVNCTCARTPKQTSARACVLPFHLPLPLLSPSTGTSLAASGVASAELPLSKDNITRPLPFCGQFQVKCIILQLREDIARERMVLLFFFCYITIESLFVVYWQCWEREGASVPEAVRKRRFTCINLTTLPVVMLLVLYIAFVSWSLVSWIFIWSFFS